jgi:hypothetical protein
MNNEQLELLDDAYNDYCNSFSDSIIEPNTKELFIDKCKHNIEYSIRWGLKIEERELSDDERSEIRDMQYFKNNLYQALKGSDTKIDWENIPTKLITITYNDKTIESYE